MKVQAIVKKVRGEKWGSRVIFRPIALQYGIDPIYFGVLFGLTVHTGLATPPIGAGMFIANAIAGVSIEEYVREGWPMLLAAIITIVIVAAFPPVVLWLPNLIMGVGAKQ